MQELKPKGLTYDEAREQAKLIRIFRHGPDELLEKVFRKRVARAKRHGFVEAKRVKKIGRNDPCPCKSGVKFKKCCLNKSRPA